MRRRRLPCGGVVARYDDVMEFECDGSEFCCDIRGERCEFAVENVAGRKHACGLMVKYGSWDTVIASPEYRSVGEKWEAHPNESVRFDYCATFNPVFCCRPEGRTKDSFHVMEV